MSSSDLWITGITNSEAATDIMVVATNAVNLPEGAVSITKVPKDKIYNQIQAIDANAVGRLPMINPKTKGDALSNTINDLEALLADNHQDTAYQIDLQMSTLAPIMFWLSALTSQLLGEIENEKAMQILMSLHPGVCNQQELIPINSLTGKQVERSKWKILTIETDETNRLSERTSNDRASGS